MTYQPDPIPLRRIIRTLPSFVGRKDWILECGHMTPEFATTKVPKRTRCYECAVAKRGKKI